MREEANEAEGGDNVEDTSGNKLSGKRRRHWEQKEED